MSIVRKYASTSRTTSALLKDKVFAFEVAELARPVSELLPGMDRLEQRWRGRESVSTTAPVTTADTADARPGLPGTSAESCGHQVLEGAPGCSRRIVRSRR